MKNWRFEKSAVLTLALGVFSLHAFSQTADDGTGPTEQPSAPMEMGQGQNPPQPMDSYGPYANAGQPGDDQNNDQQNDAQPTDAEPGGPSGEAAAQTDQGVARVSLMHGDVSTQRGDSGDWSAAVLNQPVVTGDKVSTGENGRTELQLDFANTLRLGSNSRANIANLTHKDIQIQLSQGIATYTVSKDSESEPEIDTPNVSVHPSHHDGVFRVEVRPDGETIVIVRQGEAQIATPQGSTEVHSGEMATVRGDSNSAQYKISAAPDRDDWDRWVSDRDHLIHNASSWHHTNRYYTGTHDLDSYGRWENVQDYGDVWVPNEPDGWVPYRDGNWVYESNYGWTWGGYEPWGWAPYHYGRWFWHGSAWAWWPGPVYGGGFYRPLWAPAYVSFWGWGGGWGFGAGFGGWGGFGWLPIGPCDWFHPWWGGYRGRFGVVNINNIHVTNINRFGGISPLHGGNRFSNIANIRNNHIGRALSTVNAGHFGTGRARGVPASRAQISSARMMAGNLPVVPSRSSLSASGRAAAPSTVRGGGSERFFGSARSNVARPASFQQQTVSLRQTMQQNHVGAVPAGGRVNGVSNGARGTVAGSTMQKPGAGTFANRGGSNSVPRNAGNQPSSMQNGNRGGDRSFSPPSSAGRSGENSAPRGTQAPSVSGRGTAQSGNFRPFTPPTNNNVRVQGSESMQNPQRGPSGSSSTANREGFRPFTPPPSSQGGYSRGESNSPAMRGSPSQSRGGDGTYWNRTAPSSTQQRSYSPSSSNVGRGSSSRPQLDMRQPIVRGPSNGGNSRGGYNGSYGGSRPSPSYNAPRSAPNYNAPRSGGPSYSAPSQGGSRGGASYGGGGHTSAPSGGGHTSAPSGGGGHASSGSNGHSGRR